VGEAILLGTESTRNATPLITVICKRKRRRTKRRRRSRRRRSKREGDRGGGR